MSYELLTSTIALASACRMCGRPLRDATSLALGIGPDCADKAGILHDAGPGASEVNKLLWLLFDGEAQPTPDEVDAALARIRELGFAGVSFAADSARAMMDRHAKLLDRERARLVRTLSGKDLHEALVDLAKRYEHRGVSTDAVLAEATDVLAAIVPPKPKIIITEQGEQLVVVTPYSADFVALSRSIPGRRWDAVRKLTLFPSKERRALLAALKEAFAGALASGPKGEFVL